MEEGGCVEVVRLMGLESESKRGRAIESRMLVVRTVTIGMGGFGRGSE